MYEKFLKSWGQTFPQPNQSKLGILLMNTVIIITQPLVHVTDEIFPIFMLEFEVKTTIRISAFQVVFGFNGDVWKDEL